MISLWLAARYALSQREYLERYLQDGRLEISNNRVERSIKPFVMDRKNFLFANTSRGAKASAVAFGIIETAKQNGLNPFVYLTYVFKSAPIGIFATTSAILSCYCPILLASMQT